MRRGYLAPAGAQQGRKDIIDPVRTAPSVSRETHPHVASQFQGGPIPGAAGRMASGNELFTMRSPGVDEAARAYDS